jgi:uncharacterized protein YecT (DUF1311 family)
VRAAVDASSRFARWAAWTILPFLVSICAIGSLGGPADGQPVAPMPQQLIGAWQVTAVHVDTGAMRRLQYQRDDPRLKGRLVEIAADRLITHMPEHESCIHPAVTVEHTTARALIAGSMPGRGAAPETPTAKDYDWPVDGDGGLEKWWIVCREGGLAAGYYDDGGDWIVVLSGAQLAMRWYDGTILVLARLPPGAKPRASFDCAKAQIAAENTICGSPGLAALDVSVSESYALAMEYLKASPGAGLGLLRRAQRTWLAKRNACSGDGSCLERSMEQQLEVLAHPERFDVD